MSLLFFLIGPFWMEPAWNDVAHTASNQTISGITVSCQGSGRIWGTDAFARELDGIASLGANAVAIHPYARIHADGRVSWRWRENRPPQSVTRPVREAQSRNLSMMMKPHLAYWGSPFSWRGAIAFDDPDARKRFFETYTEWVVALAKAVPETEIFVVGTELKGLTKYEGEWREVVRALRQVTNARLTYAANWDNYRNVKFWDALDLIGIQAYFPLSKTQDPDEADLRKGWNEIMDELERYGLRHNRQVLFTELGYNRSTKAAREPWDYHQEHGEAAIVLQQRCLRVALQVAKENHPRIAGVFLWKWFVGNAPFENFHLNQGDLPDIIAKVWCEP